MSSDVTDVPVASNVNFAVGSIDPNVAIAPIGTDGKVCYINSDHTSVDLVADHLGTIAASTYQQATASGAPARVLDTRTSGNIIPPDGRRCFTVAGSPGDAAVVNLTLVLAQGPGNGLLVSSDVTDMPVASNVNFAVGSIDPNVAIAPIGTDGKVCYINSDHTSVHLVADHLGTIAASTYQQATASGAPLRVLDTRTSGNIIPPDGRRCFTVAGSPGDAAIVNLTPVLARGSGNGLLTSSGVTRPPLASNVNFAVGSIDPNVAIAPIGTDGKVCYINSNHTSVHLIADHLGTIAASTYQQATASGAPLRVLDTRSEMPPPSTTVPVGVECLARSKVTELGGTYLDRVSISSPSDDLTVDARNAVSLTSGDRALEIGGSRAPDRLCVLGWTTLGQQSRTLTWRQMHDDLGGSALRIYGTDYVVDGLRADNVEDAFDPRGGEGFEVRNMWTEYIRDDCIENDERRAGLVTDSLFDGCYTFFSEQDDGTVVGESLVFDRVLVHLEPMPGPHGTTDPSTLGHGSFFKKFDDGDRHQPIIRDSVFFLEDDCYNGCHDWPPGTTADNVVIVWVGAGRFPMSVLPGMTLTTDRSVWDRAAADWKQRHGCTTIDQPCTRLHNPT